MNFEFSLKTGSCGAFLPKATPMSKLHIKPIKHEMNKLIELDHEHSKRALKLIICGSKEENKEDTLSLVKKKYKLKCVSYKNIV